MKEQLHKLIINQETAIQGDVPDAKRLGKLVRILRFFAPKYVDMLATYRERLMTAGYIAGMSDALGERVNSEELTPWVEEIKGNVRELVGPRNPWADPISYIGATWKVIPGVGAGPIWH